ncbi:sodium/proton antiporter (NhaA family) [Halopolyspora algeriensis]|uniref:Na(+)/H(+) antiporter NhaA n=1 Tax=Halopolyspora algeriensis TaxID=1500506 RepID=A0A368VP65_9ACTN|nr:Na+/H+ antiporter NhaA [Halopolyspora algeriensis]RCW43310.1 sodium/proton antiporter (NhaA family) [Halopolyspora algeriensis]TQM56369.1 sodium/proton antiporter (NhaA family) [Halopolyspora algeriensis]
MRLPSPTSTRALPRAVQAFLTTEAGGTLLLLAATVIAIVWANSPFAAAYEALWHTPLAVRIGVLELELDLRHWINDGLMALFFFVIGMEVSREFTLGEMRNRSMVAVPLLAALGGLSIPAVLYLAVNAGSPTAIGWGIPMATDTAFVLGVLALVGPRCPDPLRVFLLTLAVVDDVGAISVVAIVYTRQLNVSALMVAAALFVLVLVLRRAGIGWAPLFTVLALSIWVFTVESGLHPTVVGLALGILVRIYTPPDVRVLRVGELAQAFTRNPTPERGRETRRELQAAVPPNERLQLHLHPWTSYAVIPLFALANAGIPLGADTLSRAVTSPVTLGIVLGLVVGKFAGVALGSWVGLRFGLGALPGQLVWGQLLGGAALAGIGFTVSLFITELAFADEALRNEAKVGILVGSLLAAVIGRVIFWLAWNRGAVCAPPGEDMSAEQLPDTLAEPVSDDDHVLGPPTASVTLVEYADYECPYCGGMHPVVRDLRARYGDRLRFVFRHYPVDALHPNARKAALAAEEAGARGRFWDMHEQLFTHQRQLDTDGLAAHAEHIGLPPDAVTSRNVRRHLDRVEADIASGRASGVRGTPTFFVNGQRYTGDNSATALAAAIEAAMAE